jgi:copper chaperone
MLRFVWHTLPEYQGDVMDRSAQTPAARQYTVVGMTCAHCVLSVREEVSEVPGVESVDVDLASGRLTVTGEGVDDAAITGAVADAGYRVVS